MTIIKGTDLSTPSNRKDANQNTARVLHAASKVFAAKGYEATIEEIAAEAKIGVGTVHRRFATKKTLAAAVVTDVFSKIKEQQIAVIGMNIPVEHKIRLFFEVFTASHLEHGKIHELALYLATMGKLGEKWRRSLLTNMEDNLKQLIEEGQKNGVFRNGDPAIFVVLIVNMINANLIMKMLELVSADQIANHISTMILTGLTVEGK